MLRSKRLEAGDREAPERRLAMPVPQLLEHRLELTSAAPLEPSRDRLRRVPERLEAAAASPLTDLTDSTGSTASTTPTASTISMVARAGSCACHHRPPRMPDGCRRSEPSGASVRCTPSTATRGRHEADTKRARFVAFRPHPRGTSSDATLPGQAGWRGLTPSLDAPEVYLTPRGVPSRRETFVEESSASVTGSRQ